MHDYAVLKQCLLDDLSIDEPVPFFTSDMDLSTVRSHALASAFLKKNVDVLSPEADKACLDLFLSTNQKCAEFSFKCSGIYDDRIIGEVTKIFDDMFFHGPDLAVSSLDFEEALMVGPGASLGAQSYNFYSKLFDSPLTSTNGRLLHLYRRAIKVNPSWSHAEQLREARFGTLLVGGNRLSFVPKTSAISRSICTEPSLNMLFQKGLGTVLERLLDRHFKIDLSVQPELNRGLAMRGSLDGAFGTIDLKSASDSMSLGMLKSVLPPYLFRADGF
uniref:RNA-directed RNA polymerase n=1 Tax=Leviviridae sp. TaxID=2027243 RepID=A0A514CZD0_9VIRU|nr:MAG: RNA-dependent RNA polymerase [Leviviridae sp.]